MRKIRGSLFVSLDGVIQAPGGPSEDPTGGFAYGGWVAGVFDEDVGEAIDAVLTPPYDLLLGRRTYDIFAAYWPYHSGEDMPIATAFNAAGKYVLSRGGLDLSWAGSRHLASIDELAELKKSDGPDLVIQGSGTLYPALIAAGLLDSLTLMIHPLVLGRGKRWFGDETPARMLRMTGHRVSAAGTVIATYEPAGPVEPGTMGDQPPSPREEIRQRRMAEGSW
jgi:dihydrofolate reductase